jgi:threonine dehydratase
MAINVTLPEVYAARRRIAPYVRRTPSIASDWLSRASGAQVSLKLESLQPTHSFKVRGAFNASLSFRDQHGAGGSGGGNGITLVTASTGNHGRALSHATHTLGLGCVVFAPASTPAVKQDGIRRNGATLIAEAASYEEAEAAAMRYAAEHGNTGAVQYLSSYNDDRLIAGTGTITLEICEDDPHIDTIVVPLAGGGLISGIAIAAKTINPRIRVIGVEAANNPFMFTARKRGFMEAIPVQPTLADALGGNNDPQTVTFDYLQRYVDDIVLVNEADIAAAVRDLAGYDHIVAEGAGAVTSAALAAKVVDASATGGRVVAIVSGGNIDRTRLAALLN